MLRHGNLLPQVPSMRRWLARCLFTLLQCFHGDKKAPETPCFCSPPSAQLGFTSQWCRQSIEEAITSLSFSSQIIMHGRDAFQFKVRVISSVRIFLTGSVCMICRTAISWQRFRYLSIRIHFEVTVAFLLLRLVSARLKLSISWHWNKRTFVGTRNKNKILEFHVCPICSLRSKKFERFAASPERNARFWKPRLKCHFMGAFLIIILEFPTY